jgi:hypothetical protein
MVQDALFQCGGGVGQYLLGQVRVVDGPGHGDRADERTEGEDGFPIIGRCWRFSGSRGTINKFPERPGYPFSRRLTLA